MYSKVVKQVQELPDFISSVFKKQFPALCPLDIVYGHTSSAPISSLTEFIL